MVRGERSDAGEIGRARLACDVDVAARVDGDGMRFFDRAATEVRRGEDRRQLAVELGDERFEVHVRVIGG